MVLYEKDVESERFRLSFVRSRKAQKFMTRQSYIYPNIQVEYCVSVYIEIKYPAFAIGYCKIALKNTFMKACFYKELTRVLCLINFLPPSYSLNWKLKGV